MNAQVRELLEKANALSPEERIELADLLYADTVNPDAEWEAAWAVEAERRIEAYRRGEVEAIPSEEAHDRIERELGLK